MTTKIAEIKDFMRADEAASWVTQLWDTYSTQRLAKIEEWRELKSYLFATDTKTTSNATLPWENTTTLPKLCQIRDVLHSNYMSSLFPNDKWLTWEGFNSGSSNKEKASTITNYMSNKARYGGFRNVMSTLIYDYIDYGNAFAMPSFEARYKRGGVEITPGFIGPKAVRISPEDIVFNPLAASIHDTFKIVRSVKTLGELKKLAIDNPDQAFWEEVIKNRFDMRKRMSGIKQEDFIKAEQYSIDGFGSLWEYYTSEYVEILEFYGDWHDTTSDVLHVDQMITIADRKTIVRNVDIPTYSGRAPIFHVGWRGRPDNLWAMGPLDNLVGIQYRIDHLENAKADAYDLAIHTPLVIVGEVEPFSWGPKTQIHIETGEGSVQEVAKNLGAIITADNEIAFLEERMELFAGAPREAAGVRTPGEKTAFEVDTLQTSASRMFQEKVINFEVNLMEQLLNSMLEMAHKNFVETDLIRVIDNDLGVASFKRITKEDITATGILRPIGARHFSQKAKELQNIIGVFNSPIGNMIAPHTSAIEMSKYIEDTLDIRGYDLFRPNVAIAEQKETQSLVEQGSEDIETEMATPTEEVA